MSTTNRIVLLDSRGDELFSGDSVLSEPPLPPTRRLAEEPAPSNEEPRVSEPLALAAAIEGGDVEVEDEEPIPETLRSSVFVRAHEPVSRPIVIEEDHRIVLEEDHRAA